MLAVRDLSVRYSGVTAVNAVSIDVSEGEILGVIGPNGAGKTTLFNAISRMVGSASGSVVLDGRDVLSMPAHRTTSVGIARTFQNVALYPALSVLDNVLLGAHWRSQSSMFACGLRLPGARRREARLRTDARDALRAVGLSGYGDQLADGLPLGTRKRLELARALAARPRIIMLDEPANGLTSSEVDDLAKLIKELRTDRNLTFMLVEHHMGMVMTLCDRIVVLNFGNKIACGTPLEIQNHPAVVDAYLGTE